MSFDEREDVPELGFLSAAEMRCMIASGHVEIQSHARTHTWYPRSPKILDFHRPRGVEGYDPPPWLGWNEIPERKYAYLEEDLTASVPWGVPIHEVGKALEGPVCHVSPEVRRRAVEHVRCNGGAAFFGRRGWREELHSLMDELVDQQACQERDEQMRSDRASQHGQKVGDGLEPPGVAAWT